MYTNHLNNSSNLFSKIGERDLCPNLQQFPEKRRKNCLITKKFREMNEFKTLKFKFQTDKKGRHL